MKAISRGGNLAACRAKLALQKQMFVSFTVTAKTVFPWHQKNVGRFNVKTSTVKLSSEKKTGSFSPV